MSNSIDLGWRVNQITATINALDTQQGSPHVLVARTIFGRGVSHMEKQLKWHYWPMSDAEYQQAMMEIEEAL